MSVFTTKIDKPASPADADEQLAKESEDLLQQIREGRGGDPFPADAWPAPVLERVAKHVRETVFERFREEFGVSQGEDQRYALHQLFTERDELRERVKQLEDERETRHVYRLARALFDVAHREEAEHRGEAHWADYVFACDACGLDDPCEEHAREKLDARRQSALDVMWELATDEEREEFVAQAESLVSAMQAHVQRMGLTSISCRHDGTMTYDWPRDAIVCNLCNDQVVGAEVLRHLGWTHKMRDEMGPKR